jgi:hypothetical protein
MRLNRSLQPTGQHELERAIGFALFNLAAASCLLLMAACGPVPNPIVGQAAPTAEFDVSEIEPSTDLSPETIPPREPSACPALDSQLLQLTQADDPLHTAEQLGFRVKDGKVQVLLVLASEDTDFLQKYGVEPGTQAASQVQAFVPIDQLCELANADPVLAIRPAAQAVPQQ